MAELLKNGKWSPVVWRDGFGNMVKLIDNKYELVECETQQEAEAMEKKYNKLWR